MSIKSILAEVDLLEMDVALLSGALTPEEVEELNMVRPPSTRAITPWPASLDGSAMSEAAKIRLYNTVRPPATRARAAWGPEFDAVYLGRERDAGYERQSVKPPRSRALAPWGPEFDLSDIGAAKKKSKTAAKPTYYPWQFFRDTTKAGAPWSRMGNLIVFSAMVGIAIYFAPKAMRRIADSIGHGARAGKYVREAKAYTPPQKGPDPTGPVPMPPP